MTTQATTVNLTALVGTWRLDPARTSVSFRTRAAWIIRAEGTLQATEGTVEVAADGRVTGSLTIDAASIDTKVKKRDDHLRSADFFHVARHPTISFLVTEVRLSPAGTFEVTGNLTVHGRSTLLTLPVAVSADGGSGNVTGEAVITRHILGMKKAAMTKSWVTVRAHFNRARP
jgi:polyisoprenoid-binding protein YceI